MTMPRAEDVVPVRLSGGRRAYLFLPDPLTAEDAAHIYEWLKLYVEPKIFPRGVNITHNEPMIDIPRFLKSVADEEAKWGG